MSERREEWAGLAKDRVILDVRLGSGTDRAVQDMFALLASLPTPTGDVSSNPKRTEDRKTRKRAKRRE